MTLDLERTDPNGTTDTHKDVSIELGAKANPPGFDEQSAGRVQAYTFGYDRDFDVIPHLASALGAQVTAYSVGSKLQPTYGSDPVGVSVFLRLRPFGRSGR